jgi:hypothetical protein
MHGYKGWPEDAGFTIKSIEDIKGRYYMILAKAP